MDSRDARRNGANTATKFSRDCLRVILDVAGKELAVYVSHFKSMTRGATKCSPGVRPDCVDAVNDFDTLQEIELHHQGNRFALRSQVRGVCGKVFQTVDAALPPTVRQLL